MGMEMRAQHIVDVFGSETGGGEIREIESASRASSNAVSMAGG
jgi:hypothetical protein